MGITTVDLDIVVSEPSPDPVFRVSDHPSGGVSRDYIYHPFKVGWAWDRAPTPVATTFVTDTNSTKQVDWSSAALTELLEGFRNGSVPNQGLILHGTSGQINCRSREAAVPDAEKPQLILETSAGQVIVYADADTYYASGASSPVGGALNFNAGLAALHFDLSGITTQISGATLRVTTYNQFTSTNVNVHQVSYQRTPLPAAEFGIAQTFPNDVGIENHADVIFVERFEDLNFAARGWEHFQLNGPSAITVEDGDSALSVTYGAIGTPTQGSGLDASWPFYGNFGEGGFTNPANPTNSREPDEVYARCYIKLGQDFDPWDQGGKLLGISWDGRYNPFSGTGPAGVPWIKDDAPYSAGNGGEWSNGVNGWSARTSYYRIGALDDKSLGQDGWRGIYTYHYFVGQKTVFNQTTGLDRPWGQHSIIQKNRWYCYEVRSKCNSINEGAPVFAGNVTGRLYASASDTPISPDTEVWETIYLGKQTGVPYRSPTDPFWQNDPVRFPLIDPLSGYAPDSSIIEIDGAGNADGVLEAWIDGQKVLSVNDIIIRHLFNIQHYGLWFDYFSGGVRDFSEVTMTVSIKNLVCALSYIGPKA